MDIGLVSINSTNKNERFRRRSEMKEYGRYIEFERYDWNMMHNNAIALNCGRNALAYLCEAKKSRSFIFRISCVLPCPISVEK